MDTFRVASRVWLFLVLTAALALPGVVTADPWKDGSGKGRKHLERKDRHDVRGKDRQKEIEKARKHAQKRSAKHLQRADDPGEAARRAVRYAARPAPVAAQRGMTASSGSPQAGATGPQSTRASLGTRSLSRAGIPAQSSTDLRRRAAVSGYISRHPGG